MQDKTRFDWAMAFLQVVEQGGFTAAAAQAGLSKTQLSKQVAQLERSLGAQLLYRTTRSLRPTEAGLVYLDYCRRLRATWQESEQALAGLREEVTGRLRITAPTSFGPYFMAEMLMAFRQRYPLVELSLDLDRTPVDLVAQGFDLALRLSRGIDERLVARPLGVLRDWVVASPQLLIGRDYPERPAALAGWPCLVNSHFKEPNRWLFSRDGEPHPVEVQAWFAVNDYMMMRQLALLHAGVTRLPSYLVERDVAEGRLVRLLEGFELPSLPLYLAYPYRQPQPPKLRALVAFIEDWFADPARRTPVRQGKTAGGVIAPPAVTG
ncbi:LysR family transcriptional regulator [Chitinimonas lacunae]|uniref:LysR substrate-binding domain-containing protein n=1 Tax=Chitinimonas lacunae TaxID=1963018 RepID=A0ABV8MR85_9NEIS